MSKALIPSCRSIMVFLLYLMITIGIKAQTEFSVGLTRHTGTLPLPMSTFINSRYHSPLDSVNVPAFIKNYKSYAIPFLGDSITAICGVHRAHKIVVIDANNNNDLRDDKIFRFKYKREEYLNIAQTGASPDSFTIDPWTKLDRYPGNEIFLNYRIWDGEREYSNQVLVEVIPNFIIFPNPSDLNYEKQLSDFDYTFLLVLAEYRKCEVTISGSKYQLFLQQGSPTKLFKKVQCYVREENVGVPQIDFEEIVFYPGQKLIVGDAVFDIEIDYRGDSARLIEFDSKSNYLDSIANSLNQVIPFRGESFTDNSEVRFPVPNKRPTLVHFWGSWCGPCKVDMPKLVEISSEYGDSINMIGVAAEQLVDLVQLGRLADELGLSWPQITDDISKEDNLSKDFRIGAFPTYLVVSNSGGILSRSSNIDQTRTLLEDIIGR